MRRSPAGALFSDMGEQSGYRKPVRSSGFSILRVEA